MYLVGYAALNGASFYIKDSLIRHTGENKIFWDYPDDYMLNDKIKLIRDLNRFDNKFYPLAFDYLISNDIPYSIIDAIVKRPKKFFKLIVAIIKIPEIKLRPKIWGQIIYNFVKIFSRIVIQKVIRIFKDSFIGISVF
jgi:hypothetical protein